MDGDEEARVGTCPDAEFQRSTSTINSAPDGGYGWVVTTCVAIVNGHSWGISAAYAVFLAHFMKENTFAGATPLMYASVGSLGIGITLLMSPLITVIAQELGTRPTMVIGDVLQSTSLLYASLSTRIWHLCLSQGVLFGIGMGLLFVPSYGIVSQWFTRRRALANGIAIAGAGLGGLVYSLATGAMMHSLGLYWTYRILAIVSAIANITCTVLVRTRLQTAPVRRLAFNTTLFKRTEYQLILWFGGFSMLGYFILIITLANYANVVGLSSSQASMVPTLFMLGRAIGRPGIGWLSDSFGTLNMTFLMTFITGALSFAVWVNARSFGTLIVFALTAGLSAGNPSSALSMLWIAMATPSTFSGPIALAIYTKAGNYLGVQLFTGFTFTIASLCEDNQKAWRFIDGIALIYDCIRWQII
ncbi:major facilitator superfamily domain-containing protein [Diaporthe sp. PMI_573]|nr:major facilitator superfamily domain-containing protein [Diaporthaceae sp. PMI_573]